MLHMANKKVLSATHFEDTSLATLYRRFDDLIDYRMLSNRLNIQRCSMSGCLYHLYLTDSLPSVYRVSVRMQDKAYLVETELLNWFKGWKV